MCGCEEKDPELTDEIPVLFTDDIEILEDRIADVIIAMGLPEEQTGAVLRLISDALEEHHSNILDTFEYIIADEDDEEEISE
ncbi:hypothetical protein [Pelosinus baikalensis]|jgi:hypothetical protein|uniref:Uncharacterized protein n=1 Tax=Pelosinus baikalensis TaxID=2892015 RepID=A0ABS8HMA9_9FIRM|nr:hypothetical protein [Pelosinus baikalensis]MCC5464299.1 hypothetical protein [Pelosinus baikalensis]